MDLFKVIVTAVLTTLVVAVLGVVAATALWPDTAQAHGMLKMMGHTQHPNHGRFAAAGGHCSRFGPRHVQFLEAFISIELGLAETQEQALQPVMEAVDRWRADAVENCENLSITTAPEGVDTLRQLLSNGERAVAEIAPLFNAFYASLDEAQRASLDGWVNHHHATQP